MAKIYDNWERLVRATLRRELLRQIALRTPSDLSFSASSGRLSSFSVPEDGPTATAHGDGDGRITLEETEAISTSATESELREVFDFFDIDHDGKITAEELLTAFRSTGDDGCTLENCRRMISAVDENQDGFVCFDDFCKMMKDD